MSAGHIVNGQCVDVAASLDYYWVSQLPFKASIATSEYFFTYSKESGIWKQKAYSYVTSYPQSFNLVATRTVPTVSFGTCEYIPPSSLIDDPTTLFVDGHLLGWGVVIAMVAAWSIHVLRRAI